MFQETRQHDLARAQLFATNESLATAGSISSLRFMGILRNSFSEVLPDEVRAARAQSCSIM